MIFYTKSWKQICPRLHQKHISPRTCSSLYKPDFPDQTNYRIANPMEANFQQLKLTISERSTLHISVEINRTNIRLLSGSITNIMPYLRVCSSLRSQDLKPLSAIYSLGLVQMKLWSGFNWTPHKWTVGFVLAARELVRSKKIQRERDFTKRIGERRGDHRSNRGFHLPTS